VVKLFRRRICAVVFAFKATLFALLVVCINKAELDVSGVCVPKLVRPSDRDTYLVELELIVDLFALIGHISRDNLRHRLPNVTDEIRFRYCCYLKIDFFMYLLQLNKLLVCRLNFLLAQRFH
jgi:hypothetical protein